jgi:hypothetical protein
LLARLKPDEAARLGRVARGQAEFKAGPRPLAADDKQRIQELRIEAPLGLMLDSANIRRKKWTPTILEILDVFVRQNASVTARHIADEVDYWIGFPGLDNVTSARAWVAAIHHKPFGSVKKAHQRKHKGRKGTK